MPEYIRFFFLNDTATTEVYTLSLHDALPIWLDVFVDDVETRWGFIPAAAAAVVARRQELDAHSLVLLTDVHVKHMRTLGDRSLDRKSTRLNSSHANISYAVFCLKKKQAVASS